MGVKKKWNKWEKEEVTTKSREMIMKRIKIGKDTWNIGTIYMRDQRALNLQEIKNIAEERKENPTIIGGDFNARTGKGGGKEINNTAERTSKDKTTNKEGEELIDTLREAGMFIINGHIEGDKEGEWTYTGAAGFSTIDYVITNEQAEEKIKKMKIGERAESDHQPIEVNLVEEKEEEIEEEEEREKIDWSEEGIKKYRENVNNSKTEKGWTKLKEKIRNAMVKKKVKCRKSNKEKWWDKECHEKKTEMMKKLKESRRKDTARKEYAEKRKEYRKLVEKKKKSWGDKMIEEMKKDKSERKFWEIVKQQRTQRERISENVTTEEWEEHFMKQFGGHKGKKEEAIKGKEKKKSWEEDEIKKEELENAIKKLKKEKSPGGDKIPNEAWMYCMEMIKAEMLEELNEVWKKGDIPEEWKEGVIVTIFKKGNKEEVKNYRGIILMDTGYKLCAEIFKNRLEKQLENEKLLSDTQMGFRKGRSTIDAIYILKRAIGREIQKEKGKVIAMAADMRGPFDNVCRKEL